MPMKALETGIVEYLMPSEGVNLNSNIVQLLENECLLSQNLVHKNGMKKRGGQTFVDSDEVVASKKIVGLHRYYQIDGTKQTLAASDTFVKYLTGGTWTNVKTGLTAAQPTTFETWGATDLVYMANGTDGGHTWDGAASAAVGGADVPTAPTQFIVYQDRLVAFQGANVTWSAAFNPEAQWGTVANIGIQLDSKIHGGIIHATSNTNTGIDSKVLIATGNGMYLLSGTDLRWPSTTGNYIISKLGSNVGCNAPKTMSWTPKGTMWLGIDRQVYLLPFDSAIPIPISRKITSSGRTQEGIENIPAGQIENATAAYHNGYYKIAFAQSGQTTNNVQWWFDVEMMSRSENNLVGPWFGPMSGQTINCMALQNGAGDAGELLGGEATAKGYVYQLHATSANGDINPATAAAKAIMIRLDTVYHPLSKSYFMKDVRRLEVELRQIEAAVLVSFFDITGQTRTGDSFITANAFTYWGDLFWDEFYWSDSNPARIVLDLSPTLHTRRMSVSISSSSSDDVFELYALRAEITEQSLVFG